MRMKVQWHRVQVRSWQMIMRVSILEGGFGPLEKHDVSVGFDAAAWC